MDLNQLLVLVVVVLMPTVFCVELTFELPDKEKMCFHENIDKGVQGNLVFQVLYGGNYDVDMELSAPNGQLLYKDSKKQYDSFTWNADYSGVHTFCFSNEFSTFTHKLVYFHLQVGEEEQLLPVQENEERHTAMTLMEAASAKIHGWLSKATTDQVYFRNREVGGRQFAENLNTHVIMWSLGETIAVLVVGLGQVLVLRSFFSAPSPRSVNAASANGRIST